MRTFCPGAGRVRIILLSLLMTALLVACAATLQPNSVPWLANYYGVSEQTIRDVAADLDIDPERTTSFGDEVFPLNYFSRTFESIRAQRGQVTRQDVEEIVQGYKAKCAAYGGHRVYYLYYSADLDMSRRMSTQGVALAIVVDYGDTEAQVATGWAYKDQFDSGFGADRRMIKAECGL
jgi:hypothetical protein